MRSEKLDGALKTIGETSEQVGVPEYVLRFWETKFKHIAPLKSRGRRYYDETQIKRLVELRDLLYKQGLTIKGAQNYFKNSGKSMTDNASSALSASERQALVRELSALKQKLIKAMS
jgi:DNA-binding transcriptional MerR regulator